MESALVQSIKSSLPIARLLQLTFGLWSEFFFFQSAEFQFPLNEKKKTF